MVHDVDFVLVYEENGKKRKHFEDNLKKKGLDLETEKIDDLYFVKIKVSHKLLKQYAELLKIKLPTNIDEDEEDEDEEAYRKSYINNFIQRKLHPRGFSNKDYQYSMEYAQNKKYLFNDDDDNFFGKDVRIMVVWYILERTEYGGETTEYGIKRLLNTGVYVAAFPLHENNVPECNRKLLLKEWASVNQFYKYQPLDAIKDYFGVKYGIYFSWLGFYTLMLIPPTIVGIFSIIYALCTLPYDTFSKDVCNSDYLMCPRCDKTCDYWKLSEGCVYSRVQHFIDNPATIFYAIFISIWTSLYLEMWKRYSANITHKWGLTGFDLQAEPPRPEYLESLKNVKKKVINPITKILEPKVSFWRKKMPHMVFSFSLAFSWILIVIMVVLGVVIYRMAMSASTNAFEDELIAQTYLVPLTAGIINVVGIMVLNLIYGKLALLLTDMELHRTQTQYDDSLALKIYMFQFVNYYSSIFYIAFFKGKFIGYPKKYYRIFGYRQEECSPGGCLMELTMQLAIVMVGKQFLSEIVEILIPLLCKMIQEIRQNKNRILNLNSKNKKDPYISNFNLKDIESQNLLSEYLEMVIQYGFVTIFSIAFPLAPLFALVNNIFEIRLDGKKFLKYFRRPVPQRTASIGIWMPIMIFIGKIAILSNAIILAFSSNMIPRIVYMLTDSPDGTDQGFVDYSLTFFNTSDFEEGSAPQNPEYKTDSCAFSGFRNSYNEPEKYSFPLKYWKIFGFRLLFVVLYQNFVGAIMSLVEWTIPDISAKLEETIKKEAYNINEIILKNEILDSKNTNEEIRETFLIDS